MKWKEAYQQFMNHLEPPERIFKCESCGPEIDPDLNAALKLKDVTAGQTETDNASGEHGRPRMGRQTPWKQEPNAISGDARSVSGNGTIPPECARSARGPRSGG